MSLLLIEGFDNYTTVAEMTAGNKINYKISSGTSLVTGRSGSGQSFQFGSAANSSILNFPFVANDTIIVGFAFRVTTASSTYPIIWFRQNITTQAGLYIDGAGYLYLRKGTSATGQVISSSPIPFSTWMYMECKLVVHDTTGSFEVKVDGVSVGTVSGDTDLANGTDLCNNVSFTGHNFGANTTKLDDIYICDGTGSINNNFLGDCVVETIRPDGIGANTNWTPSAGANYAAVDEALEDGDTTYVSSSTATNKDTYTFAAITSGNTDVRGVGVTVVAERKDGGERALTTETVDGATTQTGANMYIGAGQYGHYQTVHETYDGTNKWTVAKVDGGEFGVTVSV